MMTNLYLYSSYSVLGAIPHELIYTATCEADTIVTFVENEETEAEFRNLPKAQPVHSTSEA